MYKKIFALAFSIFTISYAFEDPIVDVVDIKIARNVVNREPVGVSDVFSKDIKKVYCWTKVKAFKYPTYIVHQWYYKGKLKASVKLSIKSPVYRTWSSKKIYKGWTGKWRVVVKDEDGSVIASKEFFVK